MRIDGLFLRGNRHFLQWVLLATGVTVQAFVMVTGRSLSKINAVVMTAAEPLLIPNAVPLKAQDIEIVRVMGKIDIIAQSDTGNLSRDQQRATSVRVFEARVTASALGLDMLKTDSFGDPLSVRCFLKEYLPVGESFGKRELSTTRKLTTLWNKLQLAPVSDLQGGGTPLHFVPFPILLGHLRTDERIENSEFKLRWAERFPRSKVPDAGNLWLIYQWDEATFRTLKSFPALPQIVEGMDYFRKNERERKRWVFVKRIMRKSLLGIDFLHRGGYCHNAISSDAVWLTTTNQQVVDKLDVCFTDLGTAQKLADLGPYAREGVFDDLYQLGFVFLELVVASMSEDDQGAVQARINFLSDPDETLGVLERMSLASTQGQGARTGQLNHKEWQKIFESYCDSDFQELRRVVKSVSKPASDLLESNQGEAFKLIIKLLTRGRLVDPEDGKPLPITGRGLIREFPFLRDPVASS